MEDRGVLLSFEEAKKLRQALRHDLRNPLAVILGRCEMLAGAVGDLDPVQQRCVDAIARNADRLVAMLDGLADTVPMRDEP
jgi:signal transduction histidine kinase